MQLLAAFPLRGHEVDLLQNRKMLRHRLTGHRQPAAQVFRRLSVPLAKAVQQFPTAGIRQGSKDGVVAHVAIMQPNGYLFGNGSGVFGGAPGSLHGSNERSSVRSDFSLCEGSDSRCHAACETRSEILGEASAQDARGCAESHRQVAGSGRLNHAPRRCYTSVSAEVAKLLFQRVFRVSGGEGGI